MQLNGLLVQIDSLKAEIDKLRPLKPEVEHRIMQKFRLDWNYHSNAIEGNSLTLGETRAFLLEGLTANGKPMKDHLDIRGHDDLISYLELFIQHKEQLTEKDIRGMHQILLKEPYETDAITTDGRFVKVKVRLGEYKKEPNCARMGTGQIHRYTLPEDVSAEMAKLVEWHRLQEEKGDLHPVMFAALFHHRFVSIHPFDDGNGRMARILMNLILMRSGFPPVVIKLQDRESYVAALRRADANEPDAIVGFVGQSLIDAQSLYLRGAQGEAIEDADDIDKSLRLLKLELAKVEEPQQITREGFHKLFWGAVIPLIIRISRKLEQFDELYFNESYYLSTEAYINNELTSSSGGKSLNGTKQNLANEITQMKDWPTLRRLQLSFSWDGFKKGGLNDFNQHVEVNFDFQRRKYVIGTQSFQYSQALMYQQTLSEDETSKFVGLLAKHCLDQIQANRKKQH